LNRILLGLIGAMGCALPLSSPSADVTIYKVLKLEGHAVRWQHAGPGQSQVVTYRMVDEDVAFPRARNCRKMTSPARLLATSSIEASTLQTEIAAAFAMWETVANITFLAVPPEEPADILIGAQIEPEGWAFADVFYDGSAPGAVKPISQALICLNPSKRWKVGFDGDLKVYDLRYTIAHEIGHAIGLDHPSGTGQIMGYRYEEIFRALQPGDIAGAAKLYGERSPDGAVVAAQPAGSVDRPTASGSQTGTRALNPRSR
jgi:hypothetical protein